MTDFNQKPVSMEELFERRASQQMVSEANAFKTVPNGMYRLRATKYAATEDDAKRLTIWFSVDILGPDGTREAKGSMKVSPDEGRTAKGNLDTKSKLYGQLTKALFSSNAPEDQPSTAEVIQVFMQTPVDGFVTRQYQGPKDPQTGYPTWLNPQNEDEEIEYKKRGYKAMNIVRSVQKAN